MRTDNPLAPAGVKEPSVPPPPLDQHVYAGGKEYSQQHHHGGKAVETAQPSEFAQASGRIVAAHPCCSLATIGLAMVALVALGQAVTPLQFDSSVDGFAPRGTPVATRLNTGFLLQGAMEADKKGLGADSLPDGLLRGYPLADCDEPPVEVWMALCSDGAGPVPGGGGGAVAAAASAAGISRLVSSLSSSCNPICRAAVAPWARECRERLGWPNNALMDVVATTVLSKLPGGLATTSGLLATLLASGCTSSWDIQQATAECVGQMVGACETSFEQALAEAAAADARNSADSTDPNGRSAAPWCTAADLHDLRILNLDSSYAAEGWEKVVEEQQDLLHSSDGGSAAAVAGLGNLITPEALADMCRYEESVTSFADDNGGYCARRKRDGECCPAYSLGTAVAFLWDKPCASVTSSELEILSTHLQDCDRARAEMCIPLWAGRRCHTKADCVTLDPHCNAGVVECDRNACVDGCQVPHRGMAVALRGPDSAKVLEESIHGELFDHFMYQWLDRGFTASGRSTFSKAKFQFINTLHRKNNEDIAMVKSKHQLLPLYEEVLKPAANDGGAVLKVSHEGVLQMDIVQKLLISDVLHVVGAVAVVFLTIWSHTGSLFVTAMGMLHVLLAFPSAYTFYTLVLGFEWMPLLNYIGIFVAVGIGADDIFVYTDAWAQGAVLLPPDCPLSDRIAWTLQRAGSAMFLTSFTTSMAFLTNVVNSVVPMQLFGIFMALMVFFDYIYTVTWFPCAVTVYHTYIEHNPRFNLRQACGCGRRAKLGVQDGGGGAEFSNVETAAETTSPVASTSTPGVDDGLRWVERVFRDRLSPPIYAARQPIIAAVMIFTLPMAYWMFSLQLDEGGIQPFPLWHNQRKAMDIDAAGRLIWAHPPSFHHRGMGVQVLFGVPAQDTGSRWNKTDRGRLDFDDAFDLDDPAAQAWLLQTAQQAHREPFVVPKYFGFSYNITSALRDGGGGGGGGGGHHLSNSSRAWEGSCNSSLKLAFDSEVSTSWVPSLCEAAEAVDRAGGRNARPGGSSGGTIIVDDHDHVGGGGHSFTAAAAAPHGGAGADPAGWRRP